MKKLYGLMGFMGFILVLGGAGGADGVSFGETFAVMATGLSLVLLSLALAKSYNMKMRRKRHLLMKKAVKSTISPITEKVTNHKKTPEGISQIISGKIISSELC